MKVLLEGQKLHLHPERIAQWIKKPESVYPIYLEITLTNRCNHSCVFCALDFCIKEKIKNDFPFSRIKTLLPELAACGVKSILFAGAGEPLLHKNISEIINCSKENNIDAAINTNMVLFTPEKIKECLHSLSWIRVSINAGKSETYGRIHRTKPDDFKKVIRNIEEAVFFKNKKKLKTTIGAQLLLLDENKDEVFELARSLKKCGVDYFSVKPYNPHPDSNNKVFCNSITIEFLNNLEMNLNSLKTEKYDIIIRKNSFTQIDSRVKEFNACYGPAFISFIRENGNVFACEAAYNNNEFTFGNILENPFKKIWLGKKRKKILQKLSFDYSSFSNTFCRPTCRINNINKYLWQLCNPDPHINFI